MDFLALAAQCAPHVHHRTLASLVQVESGFNPYAIGVVNGRLQRQPRSANEAITTAQALAQKGYDFSVGLGQVNRRNFPAQGLTLRSAFEPCRNLQAASAVLSDCYSQALRHYHEQQAALRAAFSCYYSGNFRRGFRPDAPGQVSYVQKVVNSSTAVPTVRVPAIQPAADAPAPATPNPANTKTLDATPRENERTTPSQPLPAWDVFGEFTS